MRGFQKCWFGQGIPSKSNAKPWFWIHPLNKFIIFSMTCNLSKLVFNECFSFCHSPKLYCEVEFAKQIQWFRGEGGLSEILIKSRVCEVNTMVSGGNGGLSETLRKSRVCKVNTMVSGPPMSLNSCSFYCCFTVVIYVVFRACAMWRLCGDYAKET